MVSLALASVCHADGPAFDRPGIAFSPTTLEPGTFSWEQGLPDVSRDSGDGNSSTVYSADTLLRIGLADHLEMQLGSAIYNRGNFATRGSPNHHAQGFGDSSVAVKYSLPDMPSNMAWGLLGKVTIATGNDEFTADETQYFVGSSTSWSLDNDKSVGLFAGVNHMTDQDSITVSPNFSMALGATVSGYVEAGLTHNDHGNNNYVAGFGVAWMITPVVQLDASADWGLTPESNDFTGGVGVSVFFR
jgi:hypothetical protein